MLPVVSQGTEWRWEDFYNSDSWVNGGPKSLLFSKKFLLLGQWFEKYYFSIVSFLWLGTEFPIL